MIRFSNTQESTTRTTDTTKTTIISAEINRNGMGETISLFNSKTHLLREQQNPKCKQKFSPFLPSIYLISYPYQQFRKRTLEVTIIIKENITIATLPQIVQCPNSQESSIMYKLIQILLCAQPQNHIFSPSTKAATYMLLSNDAKTIVHDSIGRVSRETQPVKACVRRRQPIKGFRSLIDVKPRSQTTETFNR